MVVDLPVEGDPAGLVLVCQRLSPAFQIDDGKAAMRQRRVCVGPESVPIGASVSEHMGHVRERGPQSRIEGAIEGYEPDYAAHS
jgi:hypothetical protein